ncbi:MAG: putative major capsid protein [Prokaryotic dsDNA virus sp.]|nr:MAG: putative major capsid protein [Prokaryotic dsDNA virus sp.]|tara:strand:- start:4175 stop:5083 length:909 start_codon:yes stop_codon:yes gene_type:complete
MSKYNAGISNVASLVGQKEDVEDIIYDISPTDTPFTSSIGSSTANGILHQWQQDSLAAVAANAALEGADAADTAVANTTMKTNRTQIFVKDVSVTNTAEAIGKYGRASEMSYQIAKKGAEMKRDIEHAFVGLEQAGADEDTAASTGRTLTSAINQIAAGNIDTDDEAFDEADLLTVMQTVYTEGGNPNQIQVTPAGSVKIAALAKAGAQSGRDFGNETRYVNAIDVYVSPFGTYSIIPNRFMKSGTALLVDPEYWSRAVLRPMQTINLSVTGDSTKKQLVTELTLVCENDKASGALQDKTDL